MILNLYFKENVSLYNNLKQVYGINSSRINLIINSLGVNSSIKFKYLSTYIVLELNKIIDNNFVIGVKLKECLQLNIKKYKNINHYKFYRFKDGLPVNGQHTKNNAQTAKKLNKYYIEFLINNSKK